MRINIKMSGTRRLGKQGSPQATVNGVHIGARNRRTTNNIKKGSTSKNEQNRFDIPEMNF